MKPRYALINFLKFSLLIGRYSLLGETNTYLHDKLAMEIPNRHIQHKATF